MSQSIHSTAIIGEGAEIGQNVEIGPYSVIGGNVVLGDGCWVGPHAVIEGRTTIGRESKVFQFASIGSSPQDLKFGGEPSTLEIGHRNVIREYVTIQPGTAHGHMKTVVGNKNLFMASAHVGHDCTIGNDNVFANSSAIAGHVTICDNVIMGGMVGVHQYCRIGKYALIGAGAMVAQDLPPYCIGQGDRCLLRGLNLIGLERAGFSKADISDIKKVYRHFFSAMGSFKERLNNLPSDFAKQEHVQLMLNFLQTTERGICPTSKQAAANEADVA